jgi:hypothetical protein
MKLFFNKLSQIKNSNKKNKIKSKTWKKLKEDVIENNLQFEIFFSNKKIQLKE